MPHLCSNYQKTVNLTLTLSATKRKGKDLLFASSRTEKECPILRKAKGGKAMSPTCESSNQPYFEAPLFNGCVTMLIFVIPACFTASMTEANAPKGTRSSARK